MSNCKQQMAAISGSKYTSKTKDITGRLLPIQTIFKGMSQLASWLACCQLCGGAVTILRS